MRRFWEILNYGAVLITVVMFLLTVAMLLSACSTTLTDGGIEFRFREAEERQDPEVYIEQALEAYDFYRRLSGRENESEPEWLDSLREIVDNYDESTEKDGV